MNNLIKIGIPTLLGIGVGFIAGDARRGLKNKKNPWTHRTHEFVLVAMEELTEEEVAGLTGEEVRDMVNENVRRNNEMFHELHPHKEDEWGFRDDLPPEVDE